MYDAGKTSDGTLAHSTGDGSQACVHLSWRRTEDEGDYSIACDFDVLERTEDVDFPVK